MSTDSLRRFFALPPLLVLLPAFALGSALQPATAGAGQAPPAAGVSAGRSDVAQASAAEGATLSYRKVFKASTPEVVEIKVSENGACTYDIRQLDDEPDPKPFEVGRPLLAKMFELAAGLNYFRGIELDIRRRIANLGQKTFRYERRGEAYEVTFNYTLNPTANELMQIFEGLGRQQEHLQTLLHRMRYDRLGVNDALLHFEADLNRKIIPEPERLLPALEGIANDSRVVEIARHRARALIERIRSTR